MGGFGSMAKSWTEACLPHTSSGPQIWYWVACWGADDRNPHVQTMRPSHWGNLRLHFVAPVQPHPGAAEIPREVEMAARAGSNYCGLLWSPCHCQQPQVQVNRSVSSALSISQVPWVLPLINQGNSIRKLRNIGIDLIPQETGQRLLPKRHCA